MFEGQKKKIVVFPSRGISEYLERSVSEIIIFFPHYFWSTQKYQIWVYFLPFFSKKVKKTPNLTQIRCIPDPSFFNSFLEMGQSVRAAQHFFSWPNCLDQTNTVPEMCRFIFCHVVPCNQPTDFYFESYCSCREVWPNCFKEIHTSECTKCQHLIHLFLILIPSVSEKVAPQNSNDFHQLVFKI